MQSVDPSMNRDRLATAPRLTQHRRATHLTHLFSNVQFAQPVDSVALLRETIQRCAMLFADVANWTKPLVDDAGLVSGKDGTDAAAAVVAAHDHVLNAKN